MLHTHINWRNKSNNISIKFKSGQGKTVLLFEDFVLCIPSNKNNYLRIKSNYINYSAKIVYPLAKIKSFDDKKMTIFMERINGFNCEDEAHGKIIIQKLLEYSSQSQIVVNDYMMYIQHSDVKKDNLFFTNNDEIIFIDLDNISYKPVFFDILHFSVPFFSATQLVDILLENTDLLSNALHNFGYDNKPIYEFLDIIFGICSLL